jgi:ATP-dependent 26S proteasome regulatory subunit
MGNLRGIVGPVQRLVAVAEGQEKMLAQSEQLINQLQSITNELAASYGHSRENTQLLTELSYKVANMSSIAGNLSEIAPISVDFAVEYLSMVEPQVLQAGFKMLAEEDQAKILRLLEDGRDAA